ncbi:MAG: glycosyltransferase [Rhabdochlamydiaceae bacterium]|nr:glycosyltransferase [Candidatus Amphrikana amoebophyrae]
MTKFALFTDIPFWYPALGQCVRIRELVFALAKRTSLTVYYLGEQDASYEIASKVKLPFEIVAFDGSNPLQRLLLIKEIELNPIDIALVEYLHLSWICDFLPKKTVKLLDCHDLASIRSDLHKKWGYALEIEWTKDQEIAAFNRFDKVIFIQEEEAKVAASWIGAEKCLVCSHPAHIEAGYSPKKQATEIRFLASPSHANSHAAMWLHNEVLPHLPKERKIAIFGAICLKKELKEKCPNLNFEGTVNNLKSFYHSTDVFINPVLFGSGLKIKTVEALAHGVPLVSTSYGVQGIKNEHDAFLVEDDPKAFANAIESLVQSHEKRVALSINAYSLSNAKLNSIQCYSELFDLL